ncbi:MAG: hypothetical protein HN348_09650, partial [Proteobacteria bacterium]|nr:hypothetical protein [Pseudomonadota bacterium]
MKMLFLLVGLVACSDKEPPPATSKPLVVDEIVMVGPATFGEPIPLELAHSSGSMALTKDTYVDTNPHWNLLGIKPFSAIYMANQGRLVVVMMTLDSGDMYAMGEELVEKYGEPQIDGEKRSWKGSSIQVVMMPDDPLIGSGLVIGQIG